MTRKRRQGTRSPIAAIPWWFWLVMAFIAWLVGRGLAGLSPPPKGTPAEVVSVSLWKGLGYFLSLGGPVIFIIFAAMSGVFRAKQSTSETLSRTEPTLGTGPLPSPADPPDLYGIWKETGTRSSEDRADTTTWTLTLLKALEWKRLEQLCAIYFRTLKFRVEEAPPGADGGVDLRLYSGAATRPDIVVQCKAWNSWKVGVKEIRELFGVMAADGVNEGIFVTTSVFSKEAVEFARGKNIALIDGEDLLKKLRSLPEADQRHILKKATAGDFTTPTCPSCGIKMVRREARGDGQPFWGCTGYPRCRSTLPMRGTPAS